MHKRSVQKSRKTDTLSNLNLKVCGLSIQTQKNNNNKAQIRPVPCTNPVLSSKHNNYYYGQAFTNISGLFFYFKETLYVVPPLNRHLWWNDVHRHLGWLTKVFETRKEEHTYCKYFVPCHSWMLAFSWQLQSNYKLSNYPFTFGFS